MRKYGEGNFDVQTIATVPTEAEANTLERIWILLLESHKEEFGYNLTLGGDGVRMNEATKKKMSESVKGRTHSPETRAKISAIVKGRKHTPEAIQRMREAQAGHPTSEEAKKRMSEARIGRFGGANHSMFGKKHTPESIEKMIQSHLGQPAWNKGVPFSEESRERMSVAQQKAFAEHPERKEYLSSVSKKLWDDPEYRAKMKASQGSRYAREREAKRNAIIV
jgi:group I intron endonuclease